ncbi:hypothetical protein CK203_108785 [Vitis vinifera]|uniref:Ubiquitin-like protease family profile domain-containing protein n=1 Tax=Vitis vinifera TaxID=29760 RepID=A0A438D1N3_VITVI|nr:hypothetical protein CK203_108785 [Vitis vinifera]
MLIVSYTTLVQLFYMALFYMPSVIVEVTQPLAAAWSDDVIKRRLAAEISTFGGYGHVDAQEQPQSTPHMQLPSVASTSTVGDDATEVIEARIRNSSVPCPSVEYHTKDQPMRPTPVRQPSAEEIEPEDSLVLTPHLPVGMGPSPAPTYSEPLVPQSQAEASFLAKVTVVTVEDAEEGEGAGGSGNQAPKPSLIKRYKRTTKRIVKRPPACKSPFVAQCVKQFLKIPHADRVVADYALAEMGDPRRWVNSMIVAIVSRMMNGQQAPPARAHFFGPSFLGEPSNILNSLAGRVEILSSLPLRRGNNISAATRRLSMALHKALHAYRIHMDADVSSFVHVQPHLLQQLNGSDCGVLVIKFMEFWNGATLTTLVEEWQLGYAEYEDFMYKNGQHVRERKST